MNINMNEVNFMDAGLFVEISDGDIIVRDGYQIYASGRAKLNIDKNMLKDGEKLVWHINEHIEKALLRMANAKTKETEKNPILRIFALDAESQKHIKSKVDYLLSYDIPEEEMDDEEATCGHDQVDYIAFQLAAYIQEKYAA